ncbi:MAG: alanine racemase [Gemmatimonadaceae bacterium]|nr:alanine racemase [Gemmatimonadaceae bacterium]
MSSYPTRAWVEVDLGALRRNGAAVAARSGSRLLPMVKADAYGLGVGPVVNALRDLNPWGFGIATVTEGEELRALGYDGRVVFFTPVLEEDLERADQANLTPALGSPQTINAWVARTDAPWHLAIDTGMSRAGASWREVYELAALTAQHPPEGVFTHFHSSELDDGSMDAQEERFEAALKRLSFKPKLTHTDNSAALARHENTGRDIVRPGIFLYGVGSGPTASVQPEHVVSLRARVVEIRTIEPGDTVSYDAIFTARRKTTLATVAVGYADGYPRALGNVAQVSIRGKLAPVAGVVTMDMTMIDVTDIACELGDVVTLIGRDGPNLLTVEQVAASGSLSPYEMVTGLRSRIERTYVETQ